MQAGKLRHKVTLKTGGESQDEYGEVTYTWSTQATLWASIEPLRGRELLHAQEVNAELSHRVRCRYNSNVDVADRIAFGTRTLEIVSVINPRERGAELELFCKEIL